MFPSALKAINSRMLHFNPLTESPPMSTATTDPIPLAHDLRQPALIDPIPMPPSTTTGELKAAMQITSGIVSRFRSLPPVLADLVLREACEPDEFHKASVAAKFIRREFEDVKTDEMAKWILSCVAAELGRVEDNGDPVPGV